MAIPLLDQEVGETNVALVAFKKADGQSRMAFGVAAVGLVLATPLGAVQQWLEDRPVVPFVGGSVGLAAVVFLAAWGLGRLRARAFRRVIRHASKLADAGFDVYLGGCIRAVNRGDRGIGHQLDPNTLTIDELAHMLQAGYTTGP